MGLLSRASKYKYDRFVGVRLSQEVFSAIEQTAKERGLSLSDIIREILHKEILKGDL